MLAVFALVTGNGCSSSGDDDDDDSSSGKGGSSGSTGNPSGGTGAQASADLCGTSKCPAGQYCVSGVSCTPGCLTSEDCGENQHCDSIDDVTHVGTCMDTPVKDCPGYLKKCNACGGGELCTQEVCDALSDECVSCIAKASCDGSGDCPCN